ncbi:MAG: ATP-binding cassette domain-containing protein [Clostridia bacterium]|nr:ATP-binding cassette domain-containing protein [Clostridia bacterium]
MLAIKTENLTKKYGAHVVVDNVSLNIEAGSIYGLVGNNGAGKTTIFKILLGLAIQTSGTFSLFGEDTVRGYEKARREIGSIIEIPSMQANLTAFQNLKAIAISLGCYNKEDISSIIELVGLSSKSDIKFKNYSLGMKQRLGIGATLIGDPKMLILDEPTNGLDPGGIMEIRELILRLNHEHNKTILISSHIISELNKVVNSYGILRSGKLVKELTSIDLQACSRPMLRLVVNDVLTASDVLRNKLKVTDFETYPNNTIKLYEMTDRAQTVSKELAVGGVLVLSIEHQDNDLENYFVSLMGGTNND